MSIIQQTNEVLKNIGNFTTLATQLCKENQKRLGAGKNLLSCNVTLNNGNHCDLIPLHKDERNNGMFWGIDVNHTSIRGVHFSNVINMDLPLTDAFIHMLNGGVAMPNLEEAPTFLKLKKQLAEIDLGEQVVEFQKDDKFNDQQQTFFRLNCSLLAAYIQPAVEKIKSDKLGQDSMAAIKKILLVPTESQILEAKIERDSFIFYVSVTSIQAITDSEALFTIMETTL